MSPLQYTKEICNILCLKNGLSPIIVSTVFQFSKKNSKSDNHFQRTNIKTESFGSQSINTLRTNIWTLFQRK